MSLLNFIKQRITYRTRLKIRFKLRSLKAFFFSGNLDKIALIQKTDKNGFHFYTQHYDRHFRDLKYKKIKMLEIGVGGYDNPIVGGESLRMWKTYFPFAKIFALDIFEKSFLEERRIKIFKGSQVDLNFLDEVCSTAGPFDLIIDDGSHINDHVITSFEFLFPKLKAGGIYVVEDTQTSYWEEYGGTSDNLNREGTIYHFFKGLIDALNNEEFLIDGYKKTYYDKNIISMHFYHNMIFIYKGNNDELSNLVRNNKLK
ncbi:class I SAM-dependent methyltransferase [Flavobacterium sp. F-380]|uniref:Class I SAM-dependent methyltransferase n=1 Tax=Flavobacterium kayseriense TaxID=2764714 RepID=A0ABR7J7E8_9FLAO|nr:class I SAM-dependent methyltransferase [Flavobacterium kayseriense]MBC5847954.1 class I SAM-dependent methyltransferase [Flavobacterium kayseriense]